MSLESQSFIIFDVQTTGTNPDTSAIIEAGWGVYRADSDPDSTDWQVRLISLGEDQDLPGRIQRLTGLSPAIWQNEPSVSYASMLADWRVFLEAHPQLPILVHYARFKRPFLLKAVADAGVVLGDTPWNSWADRVVCTYELARRSLPQLKSYSLRAVAGFVGYSLGDKKRCRDHLMATAFIWRYLVRTGAQASEAAPTLPLMTESMRKKRLALPDQPGIYFFLDQSGRVLYVGKASSLKHRLNSYFRGKKTKGSRLNEMLTRAVDFRYEIVGSELEALLRESDAIKRLEPPYNRLLKAEGRRVHSLRLNDWLSEAVSFGDQLWGPLRSLRALESLLALSAASLKAELPAARLRLDEIVADTILAAGKKLLLGSSEPDRGVWVAWILDTAARARQLAEETGDEADAEEDLSIEGESELTAEQAAAWMQQSLVQTLRQLYRARWLLRLMECSISWQFAASAPQRSRLNVSLGVIQFEVTDAPPTAPAAYQKSRHERLSAMDLAAHDRLMILYHALRKAAARGESISLCIRPGLVLDQDDLRQLLW